jgi:hypothetical protein
VDSDRLITIADAAVMLDTTRQTIRWIIERGDLTPLVPPHTGSSPRRLFLREREVAALRDAGWRRHKKRGA